MELANFDGLTLGSVIAGIVSTIVFIAATRLLAYAARIRILGRLIFLSLNKFGWRISILFCCSIAIALIVSRCALILFGTTVNGPFVGTATFASLLLYSEWRFSSIGLHAAQTSVAKGTDYHSALNLCRDSFSFLGTGAFKLTSEDNFNETILRCNDDNQIPVRLLLSSPENSLIAKAEAKADVAPGTYKKNVLQSLQNLKRLKEDRNARFEVRFYKAETERDFENFRMMFIDSDVLLLSYNVYGKNGLGKHTPQLVIFRPAMTSSSNNFYFAFHGYFERLWASSIEWDFKEYV